MQYCSYMYMHATLYEQQASLISHVATYSYVILAISAANV